MWYACVCVCVSCLVMSASLRPHGLSMELSRQECWSGLPFSSPGDPPNPGIKPGSPELQADSLLSELPVKPYLTVKWKSLSHVSLFDPLDYTVHGILQARILEWVDLPNPGIEPGSPELQVDSLPTELSRMHYLTVKGLHKFLNHYYLYMTNGKFLSRFSWDKKENFHWTLCNVCK